MIQFSIKKESVTEVMDQLVRQISGSVDQITRGGEFARVFDLDKRLSESIGIPVEVEE